jgi:hypothetical protein
MKDVTDRATKMQRGNCLLYRNPHLHEQGRDAAEYIGVIRLQNGDLFWVLAWNRYVNGKCSIEIVLNPKH